MKKNTAIFFDRDGTINEEVGYLDSQDRLKIYFFAPEAIRLVNSSGMKAIVVTNQAGVARGFFAEEFVISTNEYIQSYLRERGAFIDKFYYCPHHPTEGKGRYRQQCDCRKPAPGMLLAAEREFNIALTDSYIIGDKFQDVETGKKAGLKTVLVKTGYGAELLQNRNRETACSQSMPDFIAENILDAVRWVLEDRRK